MAEHLFKTSMTIDRPRDEVFDFFALAENLETITPPQLNFHILTPLPIKLEKGALIDYRMTLYGFPITWKTEITEWEPPYEIVDTQLSGPYKEWVHRHRFLESAPGITVIEDEVRYRLPVEPLGDLFQFLVNGQLEAIFKYRQAKVADLMKAS